MTDFRAISTIMGPAGLTAVFGMGTGGAPQVSSPESGAQAVRPGHHGWLGIDPGDGVMPTGDANLGRCEAGKQTGFISGDNSNHDRDRSGWMRWGRWMRVMRCGACGTAISSARVRGGDGSGWSSVLAVRTGRLRRSPVVHFRPIDLVVFQEPSSQLRMETSS